MKIISHKVECMWLSINFAKLIVLILLFNPNITSASVIFSDDYDSPGDTGWVCADGVRSGYTGLANCPSPSTYEGITRYAGEISPGGRTGNSLKLWRRNGIWTGYHGYLNKYLTTSEFNQGYKELFIRWYVKIPPEWDASLGSAQTHKLNRLFIGSNAGDRTHEWYLDIKGSSFKNGRFTFYNTGGGGVFYTSKTVSELGINDGEWHSLEWHLKLNSATGSTDGGFAFYVDGVEQLITRNLTYGVWNINVGAQTNEYFTSLAPPAIGNLTDGTWNFPDNGWYAFEFDDFVVSTQYIGPGSLGSLEPPKGLIITTD